MPAATKKTPKASASNAKATAGLRRRFFLNLGLLFATLVSLGVWFVGHVQFWLLGLAGGSLAVLVVGKVVYDFLKSSASEEMKGLTQFVLNSPYWTAILLGGFVLSLMLHGVTSSIRAEWAAGPAAAGSFRIEVRRRDTGQPLARNLTVGPDRSVDGYPFFFRFRSTPLEFRVVEPAGFATLPTNLGFAGRIRLKVPGDFERKPYRVLRLMPAPNFLNRLGEPGAPVFTRYDLHVIWEGQTNVVEDLRKQIVYVGASGDALARCLAEEPSVERASKFHQLLDQVGFPREHRGAVLARWELNPRKESAFELHPTNELEIIVWRRAGEESQSVFRQRVAPATPQPLQTLMLHLP